MDYSKLTPALVAMFGTDQTKWTADAANVLATAPLIDPATGRLNPPVVAGAALKELKKPMNKPVFDRLSAFSKDPAVWLSGQDQKLQGLLGPLVAASPQPQPNPIVGANPSPAPAATTPPNNPVPPQNPNPPQGGRVADQNQNQKTAAIRQAELEANKAKDDRLAAEARLAAAAAEQRTAEANAKKAEEERKAAKEAAERTEKEEEKRERAADLARRATELAATTQAAGAAGGGNAPQGGSAQPPPAPAPPANPPVPAATPKAAVWNPLSIGLAVALGVILCIAIGVWIASGGDDESAAPTKVEPPPPVPIEATPAADQMEAQFLQRELTTFQAKCEAGGRSKPRCEELTELYREKLEKER